jgi:peptide/nickel transport system substrate-binding protein
VRTIDSRATRMLAFATGEFDITFPSDVSVPLLKDIKERAPKAVCEMTTTGVMINLMVNRVNPPFDNPEIRRAMSLALDRKPFNTILMEGHGRMGGAMLPQPEGEWGMPPEMQNSLTGYGPDVEKNRDEARKILKNLGYGPDKHLAVKVSARNIPIFRDPAVILIDQLKPIWVDGELEPVDTANWFPKVARHDYQIGMNNTGSGVDDPDQQFYENYGCGSERNYTGYCNRELEQLFEKQSAEADQEKRKHLVWDIDKKLQEDGARPIVYHFRAATCWQPQLKGVTIMVNSQYNGWRMEDWWLDR